MPYWSATSTLKVDGAAEGKSRIAEFPVLQQLIDSNKRYVETEDKEVFEKGARGQWPKTLWIGCADSRVPESVILGQKPGEVFVHRNIANQFQPNDDSANALLDYGVLTVGVENVIVCGHTGCGGCVAAHGAPALKGVPGDHLTRFIAPLIQLRHDLGPDITVDDLIVANVKEGVKAVAASEVMQKSWAQYKAGTGKKVSVHGWIYDVASGQIHDLGVTVTPPE